MKNLKIPVWAFALAAMLFWGLSFIWSSVLLKYYGPVTIIFIRLIISAALLFGFLRLSGSGERIMRKDLPMILLSALFNPFLYFLGENYGLKYSSPTISSVIIATIPVFSPIVAYIGIRERVTSLNLAGIGISFVGVLVMLVTPDFSLTAEPFGVACLSGAVLSALLYSVTLRTLTAKYSAIMIVAVQNLIGIFLFLPLFLIFEMKNAMAVSISGEIVGSMLLLAVFASSLSFVFFAHSVKHLGISKTNVFSNLIPVFTAFFSWLLLSEPFSVQKISGILLVIGGVYLSERSRNRT